MKVTLFLTSFWLFIASLFSPSSETFLAGRVTDSAGEELMGATIQVKQGGVLINSARTDINGNYRIAVAPGEYDLDISYTGYQTKALKAIKVDEGKTVTLDVVLEDVTVLSEVIVTAPKRKRSDNNAKTLSEPAKSKPAPGAPAAKAGAPTDALKRKMAEEAPAKAEEAVSKDILVKRAVTTDEGDVKIKGAREARTGYYLDGIRVSGTTPPVEDASTGDGKAAKTPALEADRYEEAMFADKEAPAPSGPVSQPAPRAGLLTAGEWNDLHNWNHHWLDLLSDGETDAYQQMYAFYPKQRYTLMLTNENEVPLADVVTLLMDKDGQILWEARTDNTGKAELWASMFSPDKEKGQLHAECRYNGRKFEIKTLKAAAEGFNNLKISAECKAPQNVDIVWAVDATGSMGDEIEYLKTELLDVINKGKNYNESLQYRMGAVFYRDEGDEYVTKSSPLDADIVKTVSFIQKQYAAGGGDFPEAVHSALEEAIFKQSWSENAIARICFLVLDASPHQSPEVIASLQKSIREAAKRGIRIVPVTASGIQKDTEFLMKFFGMATNGTYVFLTDHSGVGGKHLEPTTDEYKVEALNDLLVRLITEYTSIQTCEGKSEIRFENDPQQQPGPTMHALYYPNPAVDQFTLELPFEVQSVTIYDSEGKAVRKLEKPQAGPNVVSIRDLQAGFYTIRILNNGLMQSGKLIKVD